MPIRTRVRVRVRVRRDPSGWIRYPRPGSVHILNDYAYTMAYFITGFAFWSKGFANSSRYSRLNSNLEVMTAGLSPPYDHVYMMHGTIMTLFIQFG